MGWNFPDKRCRLFRFCHERICELRCQPASFICGRQACGICSRWFGKCTARWSYLLFGTCSALHRKRSDCACINIQDRYYYLQCKLSFYPFYQKNFLNNDVMRCLYFKGKDTFLNPAKKTGSFLKNYIQSVWKNVRLFICEKKSVDKKRIVQDSQIYFWSVLN